MAKEYSAQNLRIKRMILATGTVVILALAGGCSSGYVEKHDPVPKAIIMTMPDLDRDSIVLLGSDSQNNAYYVGEARASDSRETCIISVSDMNEIERGCGAGFPVTLSTRDRRIVLHESNNIPSLAENSEIIGGVLEVTVETVG